METKHQHGDIVFKSPDKEFMRFKGDGTILVEGRALGIDEAVLAGLRAFLASAGLPGNGPTTMTSGPADETGPGGSITLLMNGDPVLEAAKQEAERSGLTVAQFVKQAVLKELEAQRTKIWPKVKPFTEADDVCGNTSYPDYGGH